MTVQDETPPVVVQVEVTPPEPVAEPVEPAPVVVVESEPAAPVETAIDHEGRIATLESRLDAIEQTASQALAEAEVAAAVAVAAAVEPEPEVVVEPPVEEDTAPVEMAEDTAPDNEHWFFKKGWF